jgi:hypothetical protein
MTTSTIFSKNDTSILPHRTAWHGARIVWISYEPHSTEPSLASKSRRVALFVLWRRKLPCEEISFVIIVAKHMETLVDVAGAFIELGLHWSIVDWANCAWLDETIYLFGFRLVPFFCVGLDRLILVYLWIYLKETHSGGLTLRTPFVSLLGAPFVPLLGTPSVCRNCNPCGHIIAGLWFVEAVEWWVRGYPGGY